MHGLLLLATAACLPQSAPTVSDIDGDGFPGRQVGGTDCNDNDAAVHPGKPEVCDGLDQDCDGLVDDNAVDAGVFYVDVDGDGFGQPGETVRGCAASPGTTRDDTDCDDAVATTHPGAPEICNGVDDDCDPTTPEGVGLGDVTYPTLEAALAQAEDGDTVVLCDGEQALTEPFLVDRALTITSLSGDPTLAVVDATGAGGSAFVVDGGALTLQHVTVKGGHGTDLGAAVGAAGGAVNAYTLGGGAVVVDDCVLTGNDAESGGALIGLDLTVTDTVFEGNGNNGTDGGAIYVPPGGVLTVTGGRFEANTGDLGGAVWSEGAATISGAELTGNTATDGGAFYVADPGPAHPASTLDLVGVGVSDNVAAYGGGLYALDAVTITADPTTVFASNLATSYGGAAALYTTHDAVALTGGLYTLNTAEVGGGAFYLYSYSFRGDAASFALTDVTVQDNASDEYGGGMYYDASHADVTLTGTSWVGNDAAWYGGALYSDYVSTSTLTIAGGEISSNTADFGAGLYVQYLTVAVQDLALRSNAATQDGGAIYLGWSSTVTGTNVDLGVDDTDNTPQDIFVQSDSSEWSFGSPVDFTCTTYSWPYGCS
jgi:hypothetical protein